MNILQSSLRSEAPATQGGLIARARNPFWLAPMAGITDVCFRQLMDEMQAGVLISELVSAKGLFFNSEKTRKMMRIHKSPGTLVGIQLLASQRRILSMRLMWLKRLEQTLSILIWGARSKKLSKKVAERL